MKTKLTLLLLIGVNLLLNSGCEKNPFSSQKPDSNRYKECSKGMTMEEVREIMGLPDHIKTRIHGYQTWYYVPDNNRRLEFRFSEGYLYQIR